MVTIVTADATLEPLLTGDIVGSFFVPAYQRGYRWGETEVVRLLDDIHRHLTDDKSGSAYYLQPIVVKPHGSEWELVDGQQRLTTLYLIREYMRRERLQSDGASYTLRYETRPDSGDYLISLDADTSDANIDFHHMRKAYDYIAAWFEGHGGRRQYVANKIYEALFERVKVIWYSAPDEVDARTLFTRLNVGRIPLTEAELVKALLLSRLQDRVIEVAAEWDLIERDLREAERWAMLTGTANSRPTHISVLLDLLVDDSTTSSRHRRLGLDRPSFHTFESLREDLEVRPREVWERVVDLHSLVMGWSSDRDLFHKIGYLAATGTGVHELVKAAAGKSKSAFSTELDRRISKSLNLTEDELRGLTYQQRGPTDRALLLMNVETIRTRANSTEYFSFDRYAAGRWSLEHIHAQNAERLRTEAQWRDWLRLHSKALRNLDASDEIDRLQRRIATALAEDVLTDGDFRTLEQQILAHFPYESGDEVNSIANLALLQGSDNSALSNAVFAVKRDLILSCDRTGSYIPVGTRNVFLKYYTPDAHQQMTMWSAADRTHYLDAIVKALRPYLTEEVAG